ERLGANEIDLSRKLAGRVVGPVVGWHPARAHGCPPRLRLPARERRVQQEAQLVDVGGRRDRFVAQLFRTGVVRSQDAGASDRTFALTFILEQPRDAEVQQSYAAVLVHQYVGRRGVSVERELVDGRDKIDSGTENEQKQ